MNNYASEEQGYLLFCVVIDMYGPRHQLLNRQKNKCYSEKHVFLTRPDMKRHQSNPAV